MQISKSLPAICAIAVCASLISVRAQDNPAQAAARAALLQKMSSLDAADGQPTNIIVTPSGATTQVSPKPKPMLTDPQPATTVQETAPAGTNVARTNEAQLKAEAQKQAEANRQIILAEQKRAADEAAAQRAAQAQKAAALAEKKKAADAAAAAAAEKKRAGAEKAAEKAASATKNTNFQPILAPDLPISAAKEEQLQALLVKYKTDQISPDEYQTQRAAILAQP